MVACATTLPQPPRRPSHQATKVKAAIESVHKSRVCMCSHTFGSGSFVLLVAATAAAAAGAPGCWCSWLLVLLLLGVSTGAPGC